MKILQLNCQSLNTSKNLLRNYVERHNIDVLCLSETWQKEDKMLFKNWTCIQRKAPDTYGGVAIIIRPGIKVVRVSDHENNINEFVWANVYLNNKVTLIGSLYIRPGKLSHLTYLWNTLGKIKSTSAVLLCGHLNARSLMWEYSSTTAGKSTSWKMGEILEEMTINLGLKLHNNGRFTYVGTQVRNANNNYEVKSAVDITLSKNLTNPVSWFVDDISVLKSDHLPVIINIAEISKPLKKRKWDLENSDWAAWQTSIIERLEPIYEQLQSRSCEETVSDIEETSIQQQSILLRLK